MKTDLKGTELVQDLYNLKETVSQTAGPYVHIGCVPSFAGLDSMYGGRDLGSALINSRTRGERITICGRVIDGGETPTRDALVEIWQADEAGLYNSPFETRGSADPNFTGWGRKPTDHEGRFAFKTIKPGRVPFVDGRLQAPHVQFWIVARGINLGLHTRMYFDDEEKANRDDPVLSRIEHQNRVPTLIAARKGNAYLFDIKLQGEGETVFFDI